jgi:glutamine amidotransferase-like uncharacterized protein
MSKKALIYTGSGVNSLSRDCIFKFFQKINIKPQFIFKDDVISSNWEKTYDIFVMPGGRDVPYMQDLKGRGNQKIRSFVKNGGIYLGICAGAYYGSREIEFDKGGQLQVTEKRELCFFDGKAIGPIFGTNSYKYSSNHGARILKISHIDDNINYSYYNGGCFFKDAHLLDNVSIIGKYENLPENHAAIVECKYGQGRAILSGVHFEITKDDLTFKNEHLLENEHLIDDGYWKKWFEKIL